ncbi:hypothetical protein [Streptomyces sp. NBC_00989]|uniref:hypothetical protein n=1 Tax=Streptomyces sp. NBC_00989 TaxID=2903705 RepID=UPI00386EFD76|nr:hypothetical protein OG714_36585 [Streptomyces sp. NBC_00989]
MAAAPKLAHATDFPRGSESAETDETAVIRDYWQAAKVRYQRGDFPDYGSDNWKALDLEDPRKMAGLVAFAQMWLRYGDEIADDLNRQLQAPYALWQRATPEACAKAFHDMAAQQRHRKEAA